MLTEAILGAVTEAVFGYLLEESGIAERVRAWLGRDPQRLAFQVSLSRAYSTFARHYPQWAASLFDEHFLAHKAATFLAGCLTRDQSADPAEMADTWAGQLRLGDDVRLQRIAELTPVSANFLRWFEAELRSRPEFQPLFDSRALDAIVDATAQTAQTLEDLKAELQQAQVDANKYSIVVEQAQSLFIGDQASVTNVSNSYFGGDFATLQEYYLPPDEVLDRVHLEEFTGRKWLEADLDAFLHDPNHDMGVWLLVGEAGVGKTTFLAHLVQERTYLHFFCELAPGDSNLPRALQSLAAQLVTRFRLEPYTNRNTLPQTLPQYPDFLARLLRMAAEKLSAGERLVIVVDALDEAGTIPGGNPLALPRRLPKGVYLVLSQRPQSIALNIEPLPHRVDLQAEGERNRRDVETYLVQVAQTPAISGQLRAHHYTPDDFVRNLSEKSSGNWMYLAYVIEEIRQGMRAPLDLEALPLGLVGYYAQFWNRWRDKPEWDRLYAPLLAMLAVALEPLTAERLKIWAGTKVDDYSIRRLLREDWRAFIYELKEVPPRYRPYHVSLREFLSGAMPFEKLPPGYELLLQELCERTLDAHKRIVDSLKKSCGGNWSMLVDDVYAHRYLAHHLRYTKEYDTLFSLVDDEAWYKAQEARDASRTAYLNDLAQAWAAAEAADESSLESGEVASALGREIRYALASASMRTLAGNVPTALLVALVEKNLWSPAQALAVSWQSAEVEKRVEALEKLAPYLPEPLLRDALALVRAIDSDWHRIEAQVKLARYLSEPLKEEVLQEALTSLRSISASSKMVAGIVPWLPESFREQVLRYALTAATRPPDRQLFRWDSMGALLVLIPDLPESLLEETLSVARDLQMQEPNRDDRAFSSVLAGLAVRMGELGQLERAVAVAKEIRSPTDLANVLAELTPHLSELQSSEVIAVVQGIDEESDRAEALTKLTPHLPESMLEHALDIAAAIENEPDRIKALAGLAPRIREPQRDKILSDALAAAKRVDEDQDRANALERLAPHLSKPMLQEVLELARAVKTESAQAWALAWVIPYLMETEQAEALRDALVKSEAIEDESEWALMLEWLATHLPKSLLSQLVAVLSNRTWQDVRVEAELRTTLALNLSGQEQEEMLQFALEAAREIEDDEEKDGVLAELAVRLVELGRTDEGMAVTRLIRYADEISGVLRRIASSLSQPSLVEALSIARDIPFPEARAEALAGLVPYLEEPSLRDALMAAQETGCAPNRALALAALSPYTSDSLLQEVLSDVQAIGWEPSRSQALSELSTRLAETGHPPEALEVAQGITVAKSRAQAFSSIMPYLTELELEKAAADSLKVVQAIEDEEELVETLVALAPHLPKSSLTEALGITEQIYGDWNKASALTGLAPYLPEPLLRDALALVLAIREEAEELAKALSGLARYLSEPLLRQALEVGRAIAWESPQSAVLLQFVARLAELKQTDKALSVARAIKREYERAEGLAKLSLYLPQPDREQILQEALAVALEIKWEWRRAQALAMLAPYLPEPSLQQALAAMQDVGWQSSLAEALSGFAPYLSELLLRNALAIAGTIERVPSRSRAMSKLLPRLAEVGYPEEALRSLPLIEDEYNRARALARMACYLPVSLLHEAMKDARTIRWEPDRSQVLADLASRFAQLGFAQDALDTARTIHLECPRTEALARLLSSLPEPEHRAVLDEALAGAQAIKSNSKRVEALAVLAPYLSQSEREALLREAVTVVGLIEQDPLRATSLLRLASHLNEPLLREALALAQQIETEEDRAKALSKLICRLAQVGFPEDALTLIEEVESDWSLPILFESLAPHLPDSTMQKAFDRAKGIVDESVRAQALAGLAPFLPAVLFWEALGIVWATWWDPDRSYLIIGLIPRLAELGHQDEALAVVQAIQDESDRMEVLVKLAPHLSETYLRVSLSAAQRIEHSTYRAMALAAMARQLGGLGYTEESAALAQTISRDWPQVEALTNLLSYPQETFFLEALAALQVAEHGTNHQPILTWQTMLRFALQLPKLEQKHIFRTILESVSSTQTALNDDRAQALASLAPYLSEAESVQALGEALRVAQAITDEQRRARVLEDLGPHLTSLRRSVLYPLWRGVLRSPANYTCRNLFDSLRAMIIVVFYLGGEQAIEETFRAIQWVGMQWP